MSTLFEEIARLKAAKVAIDEKLTAKGVSVPDGVTFDDYANLIDSIETGTSSSEVTATRANVLAGTRTITKDSGDAIVEGTMPNNGAVSKTITPSESVQSYTIPKGYHDGNGKVTVNASEKVYRRIGISGYTYNTLLYVDENGDLTCPSSDATEIYALEGIVSFDSNSGKDSLARVIKLDFEYACFPSGTYDEYSFYGTNGEHYHYPRVFRFLSDDGRLDIESMFE